MGPRTSIRGNVAYDNNGNPCDGWLQWGRGLPSAETQNRRRPHHRRSRLQWGRGLPSAETSTAAGPRTQVSSLQWGRGLPSAETSTAAGPRTQVSSLQWGRGLPSAETNVDSAGNTKLIRLQWGRGLPSAETSKMVDWEPMAFGLQWGRGLPSAETRVVPWCRCATWKCFNGAADFHPRKHQQPAHSASEGTRFNGAADFHPRKPARQGHPRNRSSCFNGAADFHPRKQHAFEVFSCQRLALPLASAGRQTVDWTKRTLVPNPQLHACQHLPAASGHRVFALTSTLAPAAKAAHRVSNPW